MTPESASMITSMSISGMFISSVSMSIVFILKSEYSDLMMSSSGLSYVKLIVTSSLPTQSRILMKFDILIPTVAS
ncbi:hypothetical protein NY2A_b768R [Paramecium bursaria Chlorella virus NY2A]|uniref:Uncharacterized protein b768R n=1 Tax=Paramecium bursaria Chlorella virus NY2A TaxID=46021 RepID=A7IXU3_PBCVN|nr:hypothetical protein NY2A_b768R [Paramecium bursaria Chlorella virus NY2A]YP_001498776.1 hypothetical protein AR158_c695R [Paramecium bursaria Chlorella virus AR158]ABT15167.1 hypothetical protein NY2A_b768R [Paramecium bursaria Chlorella virus NY2A]ABU44240.1 hypothetical protein AR158_c695R [Paramecium bursaria Chlorella virus AR158]